MKENLITYKYTTHVFNIYDMQCFLKNTAYDDVTEEEINEFILWLVNRMATDFGVINYADYISRDIEIKLAPFRIGLENNLRSKIAQYLMAVDIDEIYNFECNIIKKLLVLKFELVRRL